MHEYNQREARTNRDQSCLMLAQQFETKPRPAHRRNSAHPAPHLVLRDSLTRYVHASVCALLLHPLALTQIRPSACLALSAASLMGTLLIISSCEIHARFSSHMFAAQGVQEHARAHMCMRMCMHTHVHAHARACACTRLQHRLGGGIWPAALVDTGTTTAGGTGTGACTCTCVCVHRLGGGIWPAALVDTTCYVMLCYVMSCYVMLCYVMLCYVMVCHVMSCSFLGVF